MRPLRAADIDEDDGGLVSGGHGAWRWRAAVIQRIAPFKLLDKFGGGLARPTIGIAIVAIGGQRDVTGDNLTKPSKRDLYRAPVPGHVVAIDRARIQVGGAEARFTDKEKGGLGGGGVAETAVENRRRILTATDHRRFVAVGKAIRFHA